MPKGSKRSLAELPGQVPADVAAGLAGGGGEKNRSSSWSVGDWLPDISFGFNKEKADAPKAGESKAVDTKPDSGVKERSHSAPDKPSAGAVTLSIADPKAKPGEQKPAEKASLTLDGDVKKEVAKLPGTFFKQVAASTLSIKADMAKDAAKAAGTSVSTGKLKLGDDGKPKAVTTVVKGATGTVTTETTDGGYSGAYAGAMAYQSKAEKGAGVVVAAGYEAGWTSKTIVKEDRFGALVTVTEAYADATFTAGASAEADANGAGAQMNVKVKTELTANNGIKISVTDVKTGITYTKSGVVSFAASAEAGAKAMITWERVSLKLSAGAGVSESVGGSISSENAEGVGWGIGGKAEVSGKAKAELGGGVSWNPIDGYTAKFKPGVEVNFGVALGLTPKLTTAVSSLTAGADAVFGKVGAHADIDLGLKDGKLNVSVDIGGALGLGFNVKFGTEVDLPKYGKNISYWYGTTPVGAQFASTGQFNPVNVLLNPSDVVGAGFMGLFINKPKVQAEDGPGVTFWTPPASSYDHKTQIILWNADKRGVTKTDVMNLFADALVNYSVHTYGTAKFMDRNAKDPNSYTFTPGKSPIEDINDRCLAWFPGSNDPKIKSLELTFKYLPPGFCVDFKLVKNSKGEMQPDMTSAFAIFNGVSLIQYLSIKAHEKIMTMDKREMEYYLKTQADYLTDGSKIKLARLWDEAREEGALPNPYMRLETAIKSGAWTNANSFGEIIRNQHVEGRFWDLAKSIVKGASGKDPQSQFDGWVAEFNKEFVKKLKTAVPDKTLGPKNADGSPAVKFKSIPFGEDKWHLIDLAAAKQGKIGLNDLIYQHTIKKMDGLASPQAVFQFLSGPASYWVADDGHSRAALFDQWWSKNRNGEWSTAGDEDAIRARAWYDENKNVLSDYTSRR